jgi:hypothetical protein
MAEFTCTESRVLPTLDVVGVGANIYGAATAEDDPGLFEEGGQLFGLSRDAKIALGVASAAVLVASAFVGFQRVSACRAALEELRLRPTDRPPLPTTDARLPLLRPSRR